MLHTARKYICTKKSLSAALKLVAKEMAGFALAHCGVTRSQLLHPVCTMRPYVCATCDSCPPRLQVGVRVTSCSSCKIGVQPARDLSQPLVAGIGRAIFVNLHFLHTCP